MSTIEISKHANLKWVGATVGAALLSIGLGIGVGPIGVYAASAAGIAAAGWALVLNRKQPVAITMLGVHSVLIIVAAGLDVLFLRPLPGETLQMPRLAQIYHDPAGFFEVRAPEGWDIEEIHGTTEAGVRLRPSDRAHYMGVSELTVRIRELSNPASDPMKFLKKLAATIKSKPEKNRTLFDFSSRPVKLLNGSQGMWSELVIKRFWVPLYQSALYGIKDKKYLCSVSVTGVKNHDTLAEVLCLGVYHTIRVHPSKKA